VLDIAPFKGASFTPFLKAKNITLNAILLDIKGGLIRQLK